jgi:hypothetical protein
MTFLFFPFLNRSKKPGRFNLGIICIIIDLFIVACIAASCTKGRCYPSKGSRDYAIQVTEGVELPHTFAAHNCTKPIDSLKTISK